MAARGVSYLKRTGPGRDPILARKKEKGEKGGEKKGDGRQVAQLSLQGRENLGGGGGILFLLGQSL